jgi:UDP-N-acetylglucosamine 1-carboxyvinyltransferase
MRDIWGFSGNPDRQPLGGLERIEQGERKKLRIEGGSPLAGTLTIDDIRGTKNMFPILFLAACLTNSPSVLRNVPDITERVVLESSNDARIIPLPEDDSAIKIVPTHSNDSSIPSKIGASSRTPIIKVGFDLAKYGYSDIPLPGGDDLGERDITTHIEVYRALGAQVDDSIPGRLRFSALEGLRGCTVELTRPRITATNGGILAATGAEGHTTIENASLDIEVDALISFLNKAGVTIKRRYTDNGIPTKTIDIDGTKNLHGVDYTIPIDRSAIVTYAVAAIATKSQEGIFVQGAPISELYPFMGLVYKMGGGVKIWNNALQFYYKGPLHALEDRTIVSMNQPYAYYDDSETSHGIYADWQPLVTPLFLQANGTTRLIETAHPDRFQHLRTAKEAGADIRFFDPPEADLPAPYLFDASRSNSPHGAFITGGSPLHPFEVEGRDIRSAAFWVIQGLATPGTSIIHGVHQLERGYHDFVGNLRKLEAQISVE